MCVCVCVCVCVCACTDIVVVNEDSDTWQYNIHCNLGSACVSCEGAKLQHGDNDCFIRVLALVPALCAGPSQQINLYCSNHK